MMTAKGRKVEVKCQCCGRTFTARVADRKRGWGKFCSKSCKATKQEKITGQYARMLEKSDYCHPSMAEGEIQ